MTADRLNIKDGVVYRFDFVSDQARIIHFAISEVCVFPSIMAGVECLSILLGEKSRKKPAKSLDL
jgi:hypothetical protein